MKFITVEGLTVGAKSKALLINYIYDLIKRASSGEIIFDDKWTLAKTAQVLGKMLKIAKNL
jgi:hypothetical protein